jgi:uridine kinase
MQGDILFINDKHIKAAEYLFEKIEELRKPKFMMAISGEVDCGKSEIGNLMARKYRNIGVRTKVLNMDSFYKIPPLERRAWRIKHGIDKIGPDEYEWDTIDGVLDDFRHDRKSELPLADVLTQQFDMLTTDFKGVEVLILTGLYSILTQGADFKIFIEVPYHHTLDIQRKTGNEELDQWRLKVLEQEHKVVQSIRHEADYFVDLDTALEMYHL